MWGRIVLGTDGSPAAARAGETTATIARAVSAKLTAITGSPAPDQAQDILSGALEAAEAAGMRASKLSSEAVVGRAGDALVAAADELDAGLIAIARGDGQPISELGRWLAHHAPCDLLLVAPARASRPARALRPDRDRERRLGHRRPRGAQGVRPRPRAARRRSPSCSSGTRRPASS